MLPETGSVAAPPEQAHLQSKPFPQGGRREPLKNHSN